MQIKLAYEEMLRAAKSRGQSVLRYIYDKYIYPLMRREQLCFTKNNHYSPVIILDEGGDFVVIVRRR